MKKNVVAMAIFPFILLKEKETKLNKKTMNHETIHIIQQLEMLWLPFFIWYLAEFFIRFMLYQNADKAYRNISFEREAYANDQNLDYLKTRKFYAFLNYL